MNQSKLRAAVYARVSSDQQAQEHTITSQVEGLRQRVLEDGLELEDSCCFLDEGHSGAVLIRPALERLRDRAAAGLIDRLYVHSPDRLARKYAYQILLIEEFNRRGVEVVFLNHAIGDKPEEQLLLQVQGMIAEYERAKILERSRRGKMLAARSGSVSVLSKAPYGYRYISKRDGHGVARFEIIPTESKVIIALFKWYALDNCSLSQLCSRLEKEGIPKRSGRLGWDQTAVWDILKEPAYKGEALYGKSRVSEYRPRLRPAHGQPPCPRRPRSIIPTEPSQQIMIPVPAIITPELFDAVQEKLADNRSRRRRHEQGVRFLLQGLTVCAKCGYAYVGKRQNKSKGHGEARSYGYYFCTGTDRFRWGGERICANRPVRMERLDATVWDDVSSLLSDPARIQEEYERQRNQTPAEEPRRLKEIDQEILKLRRGISRMLDLYQDGDLDQAEFEPRHRRARQRLSELEVEASSLAELRSQAEGQEAILSGFKQYAERVGQGLDSVDWAARREIIRTLIKRIEIGDEEVHIVYRIGDQPIASTTKQGVLHDCLPRGRSSR
jgi:site-specific DNA recombinase